MKPAMCTQSKSRMPRARNISLILPVVLSFISIQNSATCQQIFRSEVPFTDSVKFVEATGDFDGDGKADIAVASAIPAKITVYFCGNGAWPLPSATSSPAILGSLYIFGDLAAGDMNGDGLIDLVMPDNGSIVTFLNSGNGIFNNVVSTPLVSGVLQHMKLLDMNQDGNLDAVALPSNENDFMVVLGTGLGGFAGAPTYATAAGVYVYGLDAGDVNGDGRNDVCIPNTDYYTTGLNGVGGTVVQVFDGIVGIGFLPPYDVTVDKGPEDVAICDMNADGYADIATANNVKSFTLVLTFPNVTVITDYNNTVSLCLGTGGGAFAAPINATIQSGPEHIKAHKLENAPGDMLAVSGQTSNKLQTLTYSGGVLSLRSTFDASAKRISFADVDGDALADVITADHVSSQTIRVFYGNGTGTIDPHYPPSLTLGRNIFALSRGDFNKDGFEDILATASADKTVFLLKGDGLGGFTVGSSIIYNTNWVGETAVADFNNDGNLDYAVSTSDSVGASRSRVVFNYGTGTGSFLPGPSLIISSGFPIQCPIAVADLDGDGDPDVATGGSTWRFCMNNGGGAFSIVSGSSLPFGIYPPDDIAARDLDGDGLPDAVICGSINTTAGKGVYVYHNMGGLVMQQLPQITGVLKPYRVKIADMNQDDIFDLIISDWTNEASGTVHHIYVAAGLGNISFAPPISYPAEMLMYDTAIADFDRNGTVDAVAVEAATTQPRISLLLGNGLGSFNDRRVFITGSSCNAFSVVSGDWNADGACDLTVGGGGFPGDPITPAPVWIYMNQMAPYSNINSYGNGTPACDGRTGMSTNSPATIGDPNFSFTATNAPPASLGLLLVGDSQDLAGTDYFFIGILIHIDPYNSTNLLGFDFVSDAAGTAFLEVGIPNVPSAAGMPFFAQSVWIDNPSLGDTCGSGPYGLHSSRGLEFILQ
ncbi:MAG: VCBS repeat-containing protein [Planctomycetes bacterium]|nr:VCBS repeat-containing protein [Planctomycetota bacterium]